MAQRRSTHVWWFTILFHYFSLHYGRFAFNCKQDGRKIKHDKAAYFHHDQLPLRYMAVRCCEVVWYSWSSNWGADFYGGVRISLPDPASTSVVQGYWNSPNGTLAVDYPDVVLLKLLSKKLFPKAPEAYWMLRNFKIEPRELFELLGATGTSSQAERIATACQWLKNNRSRHFFADQIGLSFFGAIPGGRLFQCWCQDILNMFCTFTGIGSERAVR